MHYATLYIDPKGPSQIGFSQAAGMPGDIKIDFKTQGNIAYPNIASLYPQLVLRPFTKPEVYAYDIDINDPTGSSGIATVPGIVMNDRFNIEVYSRNEIGQPQRMLAAGRVDLTGYAYESSGPLGPASYPTGPIGPVGAVGPMGMRGSRWYTGAGEPMDVPDARVPGDMWLDESTGNVWRWDGAAWLGYVRA